MEPVTGFTALGTPFAHGAPPPLLTAPATSQAHLCLLPGRVPQFPTMNTDGPGRTGDRALAPGAMQSSCNWGKISQGPQGPEVTGTCSQNSLALRKRNVMLPAQLHSWAEFPLQGSDERWRPCLRPALTAVRLRGLLGHQSTCAAGPQEQWLCCPSS